MVDFSWWKCGTCLFYDGNERDGVCRYEPSKFPRVRVQAAERGCSEHVELKACAKCGKPMEMSFSLTRELRTCWSCLDAEDEMREVSVVSEPAAESESPRRGRRAKAS